MLKIAIIEESRATRNQIVNQLSSSDNIEILYAVGTVRDFQRAVLNKLSVLPDLVLYSTLADSVFKDDLSKQIKKNSPNSILINYNIFIQRDALILSPDNARNIIGSGSFALNLLKLLVVLIQSNQQKNSTNLIPKQSVASQTLKELVTEREFEVIDSLSIGCTYEEISQKLFVSINTVRYYIKTIYKKLGVRNKIELANMYHNYNCL
ncbi:MAG: response regulator transcription factor [bacterium]|jgi:DNA-binding NarL/FixJ family response regulator